MKHFRIYLIGAIIVMGIALLLFWGWQSWKAYEEQRLDTAYAELFAQLPPEIENRYYSKTEAFTDFVARYRFDRGSPELVNRLIRRFELTPAKVPFKSGDPAPTWWAIPKVADVYTRGTEHEHVMLIFEPETGRVFFERTQN